MSVREENKASALGFMASFASSGTVELSVFSEDAVWWTLLTGDVPIADHAATVGATAGRHFAGPGRFQFKRVIADEEAVAVEALGFQPLANGRSYDNTYVWIFQFRESKICRVNAHFDPGVAIRAFAN